MKKFFSLVVMLFAFASFSFSQSFEGVWEQVSDETGKPRTHIKIYEEGGVYYGQIVKIMDPNKQDAKCDKCKKDDPRKGQLIREMVILKGMKKVREGALKGGNILKPDKGKVYKCEMYINEDPDKLVVKGFVGPISKTQYWNRLK